jgi:hypothetical protein
VSASSYIYVDSVYIYADLPIRLEAADSHIYLRNKAQLIQGDTAGFNNSGLGSLSLYQAGNVNAYAFNFWCPPVGNTSESTINNSYTTNLLGDPDSSTSTTEYVPASFTSNYNGTSNPLVIHGGWIYTYNSLGGASATYNKVDKDGPMSPGLGFTMKGTDGSDNSQDYEFRGKPNTGTISNAVAPGAFLLMGNPYPSGLDAYAFIHDSENLNAIDGTLLFWEQDLDVLSHFTFDYVGAYAAYTIDVNGVETFVPAPFRTYGAQNVDAPTGTGTKVVTRYLDVGQGFFVTGKEGGSGIVKIKNNHRIYSNKADTPSLLFKNSNKKKTLVSSYKRFSLNVDFDIASRDAASEEQFAYTVQLVHNFNDNATEGFDFGMEIRKQNSLESDVSWIQDNQLFAARASVFNQDLVIPINLNSTEDVTLGFRLFDVLNFEIDEDIYLLDKETGTYYNLVSETASLSIDSGNYEDRFEIHFQNNSLSIDDEATNESGLVAFFDANNKEINISNKKAKLINEVILYNVNGTKVISKNLKTVESKIKIATSNLSAGIYFLRCFTDNKIDDFKIVVR